MWFAPGNEEASTELVRLIDGAALDGLDPRLHATSDLRRAMRSAWGGNPAARRRAELLLSQAFVRYARDLQQVPGAGMVYVDSGLRPAAVPPRALLDAAAAAPSLSRHVTGMGWMHPYYAGLRQALEREGDERQRATILANMQRARLLPGPGRGRYVLVNAAAQRLFMIEDGEVRDSMKVVVGKPNQPTPMMAAMIRYASLNPYWNVPPDLTAERIAPFVVKQGPSYLRAHGYQVLSDWTDKASVVSPASIDWKAVADGRTEIRVRQLPGRDNSMGAMKFMFPNIQGVYLHDTPSTELFSEAARFFSGGCVRLEAAQRLAVWLFGKPLRAEGASPEQRVDLPRPVPVYITYLTLVPEGAGELARFEDSYGWDPGKLAQARPMTAAR